LGSIPKGTAEAKARKHAGGGEVERGKQRKMSSEFPFLKDKDCDAQKDDYVQKSVKRVSEPQVTGNLPVVGYLADNIEVPEIGERIVKDVAHNPEQRALSFLTEGAQVSREIPYDIKRKSVYSG
jgi:hypothetical protein